MVIKGKRIRNLKRYLGFIEKQKSIIVGLENCSRFSDKLLKIGFPEKLVEGFLILPDGDLGTVSRFNSEGKFLIHKDQEKETCYRQVEWHWKEFRGRYDTEEKSKIVDVPYKRYPRTFIPPPSIEFIIRLNKKNEFVITTSPIPYTIDNHEKIIHAINLFLQIFSECSILTEDLNNISNGELKRLNWDVLPKGEMPWGELEGHLSPIIKKAPTGNQVVIEDRMETINNLKPEFYAIGRAGFNGYIILGFPKKNLFVLESLYYGNATYVLENDWISISKLTKAEILKNELHKERVLHLKTWRRNLNKILM